MIKRTAIVLLCLLKILCAGCSGKENGVVETERDSTIETSDLNQTAETEKKDLFEPMGEETEQENSKTELATSDDGENTYFIEYNAVPIEMMAEVEFFAYKQIPEIKVYEKHVNAVSKQSDVIDAVLYVECSPHFSYGLSDEYTENYYSVVVEEYHPDHRVPWDWFDISEDFETILWYNPESGEHLTLEEWRESSYYRTELFE